MSYGRGRGRVFVDGLERTGLGAVANTPAVDLGFAKVASDQRTATGRTFGSQPLPNYQKYGLRLPETPFTPARLAWNYGGFWLADVAPRVDRLAANRPGQTSSMWARDKAKFQATMAAIFGPHVSVTDPAVLQAYLSTAMLTPDESAAFWRAAVMLGIAVDAVGIIPTTSDMMVSSVKEAAADLWNKVGKPTVGVLGGIVTAAKWLGIGLIAYVGYDAMTKGGRGS